MMFTKKNYATIVITTYNRPKFLERAIYSCKSQNTQYEFEIIVVDDNGIGSEHQKETEKLVKSNKEVVYLPLEKNSGACVARNKGAKLASGEFLFFLDDDDEFLPAKLEEQMKYLNQNPQMDGCLAGFVRKNEAEQEIISGSNDPVVGDFKNFILYGNFFTPMLCIRKNSFEKTDGFISIPRFQDKFFMINALLKGLSFGTLGRPLHVMHEHNGERVTSVSVEKTEKSLLQIRIIVEQNKYQLSKAEWKLFLSKQLRVLAITKYVSSKKIIRRSAAVDFLKLFFSHLNFRDLIMTLKSIVK